MLWSRLLYVCVCVCMNTCACVCPGVSLSVLMCVGLWADPARHVHTCTPIHLLPTPGRLGANCWLIFHLLPDTSDSCGQHHHNPPSGA